MAQQAKWAGTVEGTLSISAARWRRLGYFDKPNHFGWQWIWGGGSKADIQVSTSPPDSLTLHYRTRRTGEEWKSVTQPVRLIWRTCRLGGRRPYFVCPYCASVREKLYISGQTACRKCHRLTYGSRREQPFDRYQRKAIKIQPRMSPPDWCNWDDPPPKPKGMHQRTYQRLLDKHCAAVEAAQVEFSAIMRRFERKLGPL